jgi:hypothetical protein
MHLLCSQPLKFQNMVPAGDISGRATYGFHFHFHFPRLSLAVFSTSGLRFV